jgi:hypothetical protein
LISIIRGSSSTWIAAEGWVSCIGFSLLRVVSRDEGWKLILRIVDILPSLECGEILRPIDSLLFWSIAEVVAVQAEEDGSGDHHGNDGDASQHTCTGRTSTRAATLIANDDGLS